MPWAMGGHCTTVHADTEVGFVRIMHSIPLQGCRARLSKLLNISSSLYQPFLWTILCCTLIPLQGRRARLSKLLNISSSLYQPFLWTILCCTFVGHAWLMWKGLHHQKETWSIVDHGCNFSRLWWSRIIVLGSKVCSQHHWPSRDVHH